MGRQRFNIFISGTDGAVEMHPMKGWLRLHPDVLPGIDIQLSNSHQLRNGLRKQGWLVNETETEVRLAKPGDSEAVRKITGDETADADTLNPEAQFTLESQLRDFIAGNLNTITVQGKRLQLYVDPEDPDREGVEFPTAVGPIDILAVDDSGAFFVFELKRAKSPDRALGQLARYMGWVKQTLGKNRDVNGVIVAKQISDNLRYAASVVPNVSLFEYEVEFHLKASESLPGN